MRRRYSDFASLRQTLVNLHPTLVIPPIPEKHSMADYASKPTRAKEDQGIIDLRRRMLAVFLNRCRKMQMVRQDDVFWRFLDPNASWVSGPFLRTHVVLYQKRALSPMGLYWLLRLSVVPEAVFHGFRLSALKYKSHFPNYKHELISETWLRARSSTPILCCPYRRTISRHHLSTLPTRLQPTAIFQSLLPMHA